METTLTTNFKIQYDPSEFTAGEQSGVKARAAALAGACESDLSTLAGWFGVNVGSKFGSSNRITVTLTKNVRGASNTGYSSNGSQMRVNPELGSTDDFVFGLFVAELSEILMTLGSWNPGDSSGEGQSAALAETETACGCASASRFATMLYTDGLKGSPMCVPVTPKLFAGFWLMQ